jgi:hypothetical protein
MSDSELVPELPAPPAPLTTTQLQKILVLWLLMSSNDTITLNQILTKWDADIAPHVTDIPSAKDAFTQFATTKDATGNTPQPGLQDAAQLLQTFVGSDVAINENWGGPGGCKFDWNTVIAMFPA